MSVGSDELILQIDAVDVSGPGIVSPAAGRRRGSTTQPLTITVTWHVTGTMAELWLAAQAKADAYWVITIYAESMGPGDEVRLATQQQSLGLPARTSPGMDEWTTTLTVPANQLSELQSGSYKLVTTTFLDSALGAVGSDLMGFHEGSVLSLDNELPNVGGPTDDADAPSQDDTDGGAAEPAGPATFHWNTRFPGNEAVLDGWPDRAGRVFAGKTYEVTMALETAAGSGATTSVEHAATLVGKRVTFRLMGTGVGFARTNGPVPGDGDDYAAVVVSDALFVDTTGTAPFTVRCRADEPGKVVIEADLLYTHATCAGDSRPGAAARRRAEGRARRRPRGGP